MTQPPPVLIIDDQVGDLRWLIDLIHNRGHEIVLATNEGAAEERLRAVKQGTESYALAIVDVMIAVKSLSQLIDLDEQFFDQSRDTGIRLCRLARRELGITAQQLPIACLTVRHGDEVRLAMNELGIPLFNRAASGAADSIRGYIEENLTKRGPVEPPPSTKV
jgi:CheY-like chemotaxis protein